jgi:hypothetical protein
MWHGPELVSGASEGGCGGADSLSLNGNGVRALAGPIRWRHYQAVVRLAQVIHLIADTVPDWDNIVDSFEQLVGHFANYRQPSSSSSSASSLATGSGGGGGVPSAAARNSSVESGAVASPADKELTLPEIEKVFSAVERFKSYSVFLSDEALVRLMTSLVALSMNHLAVSASSSYAGSGEESDDSDGGAAGGDRRGGGMRGNNSSADIIQVSAVGSVGMGAGASGGGGAGGGMGMGMGMVAVSRVRPDSSSAGLAYMAEGIRNGTISFSLQALIEITKLNAFRISVVWQMVISHLRMIASLKVRFLWKLHSFLWQVLLFKVCIYFSLLAPVG